MDTMLRIHLLQNWFGYSDPAMEETLYELTTLRRSAGLSLSRTPTPRAQQHDERGRTWLVTAKRGSDNAGRRAHESHHPAGIPGWRRCVPRSGTYSASSNASSVTRRCVSGLGQEYQLGPYVACALQSVDDATNFAAQRGSRAPVISGTTPKWCRRHQMYISRVILPSCSRPPLSRRVPSGKPIGHVSFRRSPRDGLSFL